MPGALAPITYDVQVHVGPRAAYGQGLLEAAEVVPEEECRQSIAARVGRAEHVEDLVAAAFGVPARDQVVADLQRPVRELDRITRIGMDVAIDVTPEARLQKCGLAVRRPDGDDEVDVE